MKNSIFALLAFMYPVTSLAEQADLNFCHTFNSSDEARLDCYDRVTSFESSESADSLASAADADNNSSNDISEQVVVSKWQVSTSTSEIDDSTNVFLRLDSDDYIRGRYGSSGPMTMYVQCRENTTFLYIIFNELFMSDLRHGAVTYRLDSQPAREKRMRASNDNMALGLWNGGSSIPFIKGMLGHEKMLVRATPHSESAVTATFVITGLREEIKPLREACNW